MYGERNFAFRAPERKWPGFQTLPLPYAAAVYVCRAAGIRAVKAWGLSEMVQRPTDIL
jgi:hypothetical protein